MCLWSQKSLQTPGGGGGGRKEGPGSGVTSEQREERLTVCSVMSQDPACTLLSRTSSATSAATAHLEEREAELELHRLEKKDEPREAAASERWQHFL